MQRQWWCYHENITIQAIDFVKSVPDGEEVGV